MDKTLLNGLSVLEILAKSERARGVADLARQAGLSKSSMFRILRTLVSAGYVAQKTPSADYFLTTKTWELGTQALARIDVKDVATPYLKSLVNQTSESAHIAILDRAEVIYILKIDSPQPVRTFSSIGERAPAYCVGAGKAMLAFQDDATISAICKVLTKHTKRTITSCATLRKQLAEIRKIGYAVNQGEWRETVASIGSPIFDAHGKAVAALGIAGPIERLRLSKPQTLGRLVIEKAKAISRELGYVG